MKPFKTLIALAIINQATAADVPDTFKGLLEPNVPKRGQIGMVIPPPEIDKFVAKVEAAARKDPKWFREFSAKSKPGIPLPFDERLGLTRQEYTEYLSLWEKRDFKPAEDVTLVLRPSSGDSWTITATGEANMISTLRFQPKEDVFRSPNGKLKRIEDINAEASSILGEWTGREWRFEEETTLGKTKENFAVGRFTKKPFGLLVYRAQETSTEGTRLLDRSLVVRFPIKSSTTVKAPTEATTPPAAEKTAKPATSEKTPEPKKPEASKKSETTKKPEASKKSAAPAKEESKR
jgi:cell division septation protein DedD